MPQEEAIRRIMPHSLEAEQSVVGSMIMDADAVIAAAELLREEISIPDCTGSSFRPFWN